jgi:hypothetical protein
MKKPARRPARGKVEWYVCQGTYGVDIGNNRGFAGGARWEGFRTRKEAEAFAQLLRQGAKVRPPDGNAVEL